MTSLEQRQRRVIYVHARGLQLVGAQPGQQYREQLGRCWFPLAQRGSRQIHAVPRVAHLLAIQRQMIDIGVDQDVGEQAGACMLFGNGNG
ncbi:hypothetical protein LJR034_003041 [Caballeronia sp. LjRoot34]